MATLEIEERLTTVEKELAQIKQQLAVEKAPSVIPQWEKIFGTFANSEGFEEAVRLGREYRESLRPKADRETT